MRRFLRLSALVTMTTVMSSVFGVVGTASAVPAKATAKATFTASGSEYAAYVLDAKPGTALSLVSSAGKTVGKGKANSLGTFMFNSVAPGAGYTVQSGGASTAAFKVLSQTDKPDPSLYQQKMQAGLNYIKVRDGVEIAMTVRLPQGKTLADGPFPTVMEYSGYQVGAPKDLFSYIVGNLGKANPTPDPLVPAPATAVGSLVAPLLGFASVSVQMRGTGCSGGAADLFNWGTTFDGYDAVETIAGQSWVKGDKVGVVGISYSGISQMFVGGTRPPHLAAIAPLSITDDLYAGTGYPGGIFNNGFAKSWLAARLEDAKPAPEGGQPWAKELVKEGDQHCIANQKLHAAAQNPFDVLKQNPYRTPAVFDQRAPKTWAKKVDVPTFLVGAFQDEQTGGHWPEIIQSLSGNRNLWVTVDNGTHVDSLGPGTLTRWVEFIDLFVANEVPKIPDTVLALGSQLFDQIAGGAPAADLQQSRFASMTDANAAKAQFEKDPRVRILMDNGAGDKGPGALQPTWEFAADQWPPKGVTPTAYFLGDKGALTTTKPSGSGKDSYVSDPSVRPLTTLPGDGEADAWKAQPPYNWKPIVSGKGLGYQTAAFTDDTTIAGPSSLDLYLQSSAKDTDIQVTISEIRPDGKESYVQSGWLRASHRKDGAGTTAIDPVPTHLPQDANPLPKGKFELVRVPIFPVAWVFRAGSKLRISITAPGGDRPRWKFQTIENGKTTNTLSRSAAYPSKLVLPVLPGQKAGIPLPACGADRGTMCRDYAPASNGG